MPGGGGKWIAQKFKELPSEFRASKPLRLPSECAPPPLPLDEMLRLAREQQRGRHAAEEQGAVELA